MFNLNVSTRSIQRCLNIMGWEKVRAKYCPGVSLKNRRESIAFATMANHFNDQFDNLICIDESAIKYTRNAYKIWNKPFVHETRLGLQEKYPHFLNAFLVH